MRKRLFNGDLRFLPMPLVSRVKGGGQCLDGVMLCLKPFDFIDFSLKLTKDSMFPNSHFCVKI